MTTNQAENEEKRGVSARGSGDRRQDDRRRLDRRAPLPMWRRPWAFVAYGVAGALLLVLLLRPGGGDSDRVDTGEVVTRSARPVVEPASAANARAAVQNAYTVGDYERLLAQGETAVGQRVRTELYCESINQVQMRSVPRVHASVAAVADVNGRVPGAECRWSAATSAPELLLLVPSQLAEQFAAAPEVEQGFVRRRRVHAELEWIGRSEALALRNVGVLRAIPARD